MSGAPTQPGTESAADAARPAGDFSPGELAGAFAGSLGTFLAAKLRLLELELYRDLAAVRSTAWIVGAFAALLILAVVFAGAGAALLLGEAMGSPGGGFLVVAALYGVVSLVLIAAGRRRLKRLGSFLAVSRADLKRDVEWLKSLF